MRVSDPYKTQESLQPIFNALFYTRQYQLHLLHENSKRCATQFLLTVTLYIFFEHTHRITSGPGSSVGIATGYGLDGPAIESRWGARFSAPVQTGPAAHPASCTMGTGSFPGVKSGRAVKLTPHLLLVP